MVWRCLGAVWGGLGAQRARKPTRMHFRMRKPRSWLTLGGCFLVQFVVFFCVFFCCLFVLAPRTVFYGFLCDFELIFDSISWVFCSKVEVVFFATLASKTMIFKVPGLLFFSVFFQSFPHSIPDLIFLVFLVILESPRLLFSSFWAWFFDIKKKESKKGLRVFTGVCGPTGGGPFKQDNIPPETAFQHQFTPAVPEGTVAD